MDNMFTEEMENHIYYLDIILYVILSGNRYFKSFSTHSGLCAFTFCVKVMAW